MADLPVTTMKNPVLILLILLTASSCAVQKNYSPSKKYGAPELYKDYDIFRAVLEESHPGLYWYTSRDSMDYYFEQGRLKIRDSMHEYQFRNILSYVLAQAHCGHSTVHPSKGAIRYASRSRGILFPLSIKAWSDTVVVTSNVNRNDSMVTRGVILHSIEGRPIGIVLDSLFRHISSDGYNTTHKYQVLSNGGNFRSYYSSIFGLKPKMEVGFADSAGEYRVSTLTVYSPPSDSAVSVRIRRPPLKARERRKAALQAARSFRIDSALNTAFLDVNTFSRNMRIRPFLRRSFREIKKQGIGNLVVDLRANGGGSVTLSNLLTKYIADQPFRIADSLYAITNRSRYARYQENYLVNRLFFLFMTKKSEPGRYHFRMYEGKYFRPRKRNHFEGQAYLLTGGNTFSAASLVTKSLRDQENVMVVGEETGGGAYGNSAWLIPQVTLPETKIRFRLPLFRLVIDSTEQKGRGVLPEVEALPSVDAIRKGRDYKIAKVRELIGGHEECMDAVVSWHGEPAADGLGWMLTANGKNFKPEDLPEEFRKEGLPVRVCLLNSGKQYACFCLEPIPLYIIRSISKR